MNYSIRLFLSLLVLASSASCETITDPDLTGSIQTSMLKHGQCKAKLGNVACTGFAVKDRISVYSKPDESSRILGYSHSGAFIALVENVEDSKFPGWVSKVARNDAGWGEGWIRNIDIVLSSELRRVVGCWPIKALGWREEEAGDYAGGDFKLQFDLSGTLLSSTPVYYPASRYAVYYADGVFLILHINDLLSDYPRFAPIFMFDYTARKVTISAPAMNPHFELFSKETLKNCVVIPLTDPNEGVKFNDNK